MKNKLPTTKIKQGRAPITVTMIGFYPNHMGLKNSGYIVALDQSGIDKDEAIRLDKTGHFLYIHEARLPMAQRIALHRESRLMGDRPLVYDERAKSVQFDW